MIPGSWRPVSQDHRRVFYSCRLQKYFLLHFCQSVRRERTRRKQLCRSGFREIFFKWSIIEFSLRLKLFLFTDRHHRCHHHHHNTRSWDKGYKLPPALTDCMLMALWVALICFSSSFWFSEDHDESEDLDPVITASQALEFLVLPPALSDLIIVTLSPSSLSPSFYNLLFDLLYQLDGSCYLSTLFLSDTTYSTFSFLILSRNVWMKTNVRRGVIPWLAHVCFFSPGLWWHVLTLLGSRSPDSLIHTWFERISMMAIILNCITLGMYHPCGDVVCTSTRCQALELFDDFIFVFFALEMVIKMIAMGVRGTKGAYLSETWNRLDAFIVIAGSVLSSTFLSHIVPHTILDVDVATPDWLSEGRRLRLLRYYSHEWTGARVTFMFLSWPHYARRLRIFFVN